MNSPLKAAPRWQLTPLLRKAFLFSGSSGISQAMMMLYTILLARRLKPDDYGVFFACYSVTSLTAFLIGWGMDTWLLRQAATHPIPRGLTGRVLTLKAGLGVVWGLGLGLLMPQIRPELYISPLILVSIVDTWLDSAFNSAVVSLNALSHTSKTSTLMLISRGGRLLGAVVLILAGTRAPLGFALARMAATLLGAAVATLILRPTFKSQGLPSAAQTFRQALPYGVAEILGLLYLQVDVTLLALILGDKIQVGHYGPALSFTNALFIMPSAIYYVVLPVLVRAFKDRPNAFLRLTIQMFASMGILGGLMWLFIQFFGQWLASTLLGEAYRASGALMVTLSPLLFLRCLCMANTTLLIAVDRQKDRIIPLILATAVNIPLNFMLIPVLKASGSARSYVLSEFVLLASYSWQSWRWYKTYRQSRKVEVIR